MRKLFAGLALTLVLAACADAPTHSSGDGAEHPTSLAGILIAAAETTEAAGSAHLAFDFSVLSGDTARSFTGDADVNFGDGDPAMAEAHMRFAFPKTLGPPTPWIKIDPATVPGMAGQLGSLTGGQADPTGSLTMLYGLIDVEVVGTEQVDGASATHYRATFDLTKALEQVPDANREALQQAIDGIQQQTGGTDVAAMPIDVWLDGDGYLKQFRYVFEIPAGAAGGRGSFGMNMTLSHGGRSG